MALGMSALTGSLHPQIAKLRQQLEGVIPERTAAVAQEAAASPLTLLDHVKANAPLLMELGSSLLQRVQPSPDRVQKAANAERRPATWVGRIGWKKPAFLVAVALGSAYLLGRFHRPATRPTKPMRAALDERQTGRSRASMA